MVNRIGVTSYGMDKPVADNSTPEGRALNRRVVCVSGIPVAQYLCYGSCQ
jgi:outer membrane protein OmpA-like peptidoglycan-associated protein